MGILHICRAHRAFCAFQAQNVEIKNISVEIKIKSLICFYFSKTTMKYIVTVQKLDIYM